MLGDPDAVAVFRTWMGGGAPSYGTLKSSCALSLWATVKKNLPRKM